MVGRLLPGFKVQPLVVLLDVVEQIACAFNQTAVAVAAAVRDEADVERYLELTVRRGARFHVEEEWAADILSNENLSGTQKMDRIDDYELFVLEDSVGDGGSD